MRGITLSNGAQMKKGEMMKKLILTTACALMSATAMASNLECNFEVRSANGKDVYEHQEFKVPVGSGNTSVGSALGNTMEWRIELSTYSDGLTAAAVITDKANEIMSAGSDLGLRPSLDGKSRIRIPLVLSTTLVTHPKNAPSIKLAAQVSCIEK